MLTIAVDAMGGDFAPTREIEGAIEAACDLGVKVILVGRSEQIEPELRHQKAAGRSWPRGSIDIADAREVITMADPIAAVRRKRNSSVRVAAQLVREGHARAMVSAGNTGAVMITAKLVIGALPHVDRPALAAVLPTVSGRGTVILDVGANAECKAVHLYQFAVMGSLYSRFIVGVARPTVGLLSIGEEEIKGNDLTKEAFKLLRNSRLNFIGNVEGRDMYTGQTDVIVCDGFTGNIALKVSEGVTETIISLLKEELRSSLQTKAGAILSRPAFRRFRRRVDYAEYGGALLIGIKGVTVICHGRSNAKAIRNAIGVARDFCLGDINERIEAEIGEHELVAQA
jgi:glycerol-3-phosphate acyltransferase PlsX